MVPFAEIAMAHTFYTEIHLHLTWHTKDSRPCLTPEIEPIAWDALRRKAASYRGVLLHQVGGIEDHVHVPVTIPPTVLISELVGRLKGYSSWVVNQTFSGRADKFEWQPGYGAVSFGTRNLLWVVHYIQNQREHHCRGTAIDRLECWTTAEEVTLGQGPGLVDQAP
jgi:putative transposase